MILGQFPDLGYPLDWILDQIKILSLMCIVMSNSKTFSANFRIWPPEKTNSQDTGL